jgi:hypothetical protein
VTGAGAVRPALTFWDKALLACVLVTHVLLIVGPLDVLAPIDAHHIGSMLWHGKVPYRDFGFEYPPFAALAFLLPGLVPAGLAKTVLALQATAAEVALAWFVLRHHPGAARRYALLSVLLFPFLSGGFDALPMLAIALSTELLARDRRSGWWVAAAGVAIKLSPATAWTWSRAQLRAAVAAAVATAAVVLAPLTLARTSDDTFVGWSLHRGVEAESVAASVAWIGHLLTGSATHLVYRFRATEIVGASGVGLVVAGLAALGLLAVRVYGGRVDPWVASFAAILLFMCGFKVLSPQYIAWAAPVAAVAGRRWWQVYVGVAGLTTLTYEIANTRTSLLGLTAVRNAVLVGLAIAALWSCLQARTHVRDVTPVL